MSGLYSSLPIPNFLKQAAATVDNLLGLGAQPILRLFSLLLSYFYSISLLFFFFLKKKARQLAGIFLGLTS